MNFQAILVEKDGTTSLQNLSEDQLPEGNVTVAIEHTTLNYKDGLCLQPDNGLVRNYPHVPGIDFAGTVTESSDSRYQSGDQVVLTGWGVGERHWGGFSEKARVKADWLVPLATGLTTRHTMAIGTAGLAAMLAVMALEENGLKPEQGEVLVTGASGGVGSIATLILSQLGYKVAAVTGKEEAHSYLTQLGAQRVISRDSFATPSNRPLESATWAGCIDSVGGSPLAKVISQLQYGASVAAVGLAGGSDLPTSVIPFLLRGVSLLGIDSVMQPYQKRIAAWQKLSEIIPRDILETLITEASLADAPQLGEDILKGKIQGRVVIQIEGSS